MWINKNRLLRNKLIAGFLLLIPTIVNAQTISRVDQNEVTSETSGQLTSFINFLIVKIPSFIAAIILGVLFFVLAKALKRIAENRIAAAAEDNTEIQILVGRTTYTGTLIVGITVALKVAGIDLTTIIAAAGFGIGFALKDIITNFLAGVMILAQRQFTIGDYINVNDTVGKIIEIQTRATILQQLDGTMVVVPNSELFNKQVISYTSNAFRRIEIQVGVEYATDLNIALETCLKACRSTEGILLEPKPSILVDEFADNSINLKVRAWVESKGPWLQIKTNLAINLKREFDKMNINIPFPIRTLVWDSPEHPASPWLVEAVTGEKQKEIEGPKWMQEAAKKQAQTPPNIKEEVKKESTPLAQKLTSNIPSQGLQQQSGQLPPSAEQKPQPVSQPAPPVKESQNIPSLEQKPVAGNQNSVPQKPVQPAQSQVNTQPQVEQKPATQENKTIVQKPQQIPNTQTQNTSSNAPQNKDHVFELPGMDEKH